MPQDFRQTLKAKLQSIAALQSIIGGALYADVLPQTHDLGAQGPALSYTIITYPRGQVMGGLDGTGNARVQISAWSYSKAQSVAIQEAILPVLNTVPIANPWGDGTIFIKSCTHQDESDQTEKADDGSDRYVHQIYSEWQINHYLMAP